MFYEVEAPEEIGLVEENKFDLMMVLEKGQVGEVKTFGHAAARGFDVDNQVGAAVDGADIKRAVGLDQNCIIELQKLAD
ncbi:MAG: hypothetical protein J7L73_06805 [Anaerolineales bacterium]|nr:hypothetical protein [Anaerolineales bacterium]